MITEGEIDETLAASFPASDPPSWTLGVESGQGTGDDGSQQGEQAENERGGTCPSHGSGPF